MRRVLTCEGLLSILQDNSVQQTEREETISMVSIRDYIIHAYTYDIARD
jgi:hypothetical protein